MSEKKTALTISMITRHAMHELNYLGIRLKARRDCPPGVDLEEFIRQNYPGEWAYQQKIKAFLEEERNR